MIETERDYKQAIDRIASLMEDPDGHVGVIKSLAKKIEDYEVKIIREDKVLAKTKGHYRCPEGL